MLAACLPEHEAEASLSGNASVTISVTGMIGWHSDWRRSITLSDGLATASRDLFEDTGWWRGTHLYLHASGAYVVHEGQAGCFAFSVEPITFDVLVPASCAKTPDAAARLSADTPEYQGYPASAYYAGLFYIGRFVEAGSIQGVAGTRPSNPIIFQTHERQSEPELPDLL